MKVFTVAVIVFFLISVPIFSGGQAEEPPLMDGGTMEAADDGDSMMPNPIIEFRSSAHAMKLAEEKPTVLFFHASWCPSCKSSMRNFESNKAKLKDVNLVIVDYDNSDDLQKKYGVSYQHTFVQIDANGRSVVKWNGGGTDQLLKKIKAM